MDALVLFPLEFEENVFSFPRPLVEDYWRLCPHCNRLKAEEVVHQGKDPTFVYAMLYAFIFQDALHFGFINEDAMINLAKAIEHYEWSEFETIRKS